MVSYTIEGTVQNEWKRSYFKVVIIVAENKQPLL